MKITCGTPTFIVIAANSTGSDHATDKPKENEVHTTEGNITDELKDNITDAAPDINTVDKTNDAIRHFPKEKLPEASAMASTTPTSSAMNHLKDTAGSLLCLLGL